MESSHRMGSSRRMGLTNRSNTGTPSSSTKFASLSQMQDFPFFLPSLLSFHFPPWSAPRFLSIPFGLSLSFFLSFHPFFSMTHLQTCTKKQIHLWFSNRQGAAPFLSSYTLASLAIGQKITVHSFVTSLQGVFGPPRIHS